MGERVHCPLCRQLLYYPDDVKAGARWHCSRCGQRLSAGGGMNRLWTVAVTVAALVLYLPANTLPVLRFYYLGAYNENTVIDGAVALMRSGMWPVALVVFLASVLVPLLKLMGLLYLAAPSAGWDARRRTALYRLLEFIGPWAMLDVFIVAVLVALMKVGNLATVLPGPGLWAFAAVVVLTLVATQGFDPATLWAEADERGA